MKIALLFFALLSTITLYSQTQIGGDIDGEAEGDESGSSVSLSSDGNVVAIGAPRNDGNGTSSGHVRVYRNNSGVWTQIGDDIDGEALGDNLGYSVSLSTDGSILAVGAKTDTGRVRIYKNISNVWTQIGADIDGEAEADECGYSVSLSSDGSVVAIGAPRNNGNGASSGHVRVYKNNAGVWTQIGADIDGEVENDRSGWSVGLSSDGNTVAVGAPFNGGNGFNSGHVRVFNNRSGIWTQVGEDIDGEESIDRSGWSVSLSSDGSVVAIGANWNKDQKGQVRIYKNNSGVWTQVGADIDGEETGDNSGYSVSLSSDGSVVAIGAYVNDGNGITSGQVRAYKNNSGVWTQIGVDIDGEALHDVSGTSVSLSSDGRTVAIGAPGNGANGYKSGHVRVYDLSAFVLGVSDKNISENFTVYPNPVSNQLQLKLANPLEYKQAAIYNHFGQVVLQSKTSTIDVSCLASGIYLLEVETNNGKGINKFIKR